MTDASDLTRRSFVVSLVVLPAAMAGAQPTTKPAGLDAGPVADLKRGWTDTFAKSDRVLIHRREDVGGDVIFASTSTCTHNGCGVRVADGPGLRCPCHGSTFDADGRPTKGPAARPLPRHPVTVVDGRLFVDTGKRLLPDRWSDDGASVRVGS